MVDDPPAVVGTLVGEGATEDGGAVDGVEPESVDGAPPCGEEVEQAASATHITIASRERRTAANGTLAAMPRTCDSCGRDGEEVFAVHRKYVTPETWDTPGSERVLDEVEHWCFPCLTSYPHVLVEQ